MAGSAQSEAKLLQLLQRAAEELKAAHAELERERAAHRRTKSMLEELAQSGPGSSGATNTSPIYVPAERRADSTSVGPPPTGMDEAPSDSNPKVAMGPRITMEERTAVGMMDERVSAELRARDLEDALAEEKAKYAALLAQLEQTQEVLTARTLELDSLALAKPVTAPMVDPSALEQLQAQLDEANVRAVAAESSIEEAQQRVSTAELAASEAAAHVQALEGAVQAERQRADEALTQTNALMVALETEQKRADAAEAEATSLQLSISALKGDLHAFKERITELEAEVSTVRAAGGEQVKPLEDRVHQLEGELGALKARRDELNVELAHVESERNQLRAKLATASSGVDAVKAEAEAARVAREAEFKALRDQDVVRIVEVEQHFQQELVKSQALANKLVETRTKVRELETAVAEARSRIATLETEAARLEDTRRSEREQALAEQVQRDAELRRDYEDQLEAERAARERDVTALEQELATERDGLAAAIARQTQTLAARVAELEGGAQALEDKAAHAMSEWQHANQQYAQLHRELLSVLDQRDEALKQVEALRGQQ